MSVDVATQARWYACGTCEDVSWFDTDPACFVCGNDASRLHHQPHLKDAARMGRVPDGPAGTLPSRFGPRVEAHPGTVDVRVPA